LNNSNLAGATAEAYVHYRLRSWGLDAQFAGGINPPFDLWTEVSGRIFKIQVKGASALNIRQDLRRDAYLFHTATGSGGLYHPDDWDLMSLVALPEQRAWFTLRGDTKTRRLLPECFTEEEEIKSWNRILKLMEENENGRK